MNQYPELEKQSEIINSGKNCLLSNFLDWLQENQYLIAEYIPFDDKRFDNLELLPISISKEQLLAKYFDIDLHKIEDERRALLESIQS